MATQSVPNSESIDTSRFECIDGRLVERPVPNIRHSQIQRNLTLLLCPVAKSLQMDSGPELSVDRSAGKSDWMTPDFAVSMPGGYRSNANGHALPPIFLVVEVLPPGQNFREMRQKADRYLVWGSQAVWLIDPDSASAMVFDTGETGSGQFLSEELLRAGDVAVSLAEILK